MVQLDGRSQGGTCGPEGGAGDFDIKEVAVPIPYVTFYVEPYTPSSIPAWMFGDHFNEVASNKDVFTRPEPDIEFYMAAQKRGELVFVVARVADTLDLVGYVALLLRPHPHYRRVIAAVGDLHYLLPSFRGLGVGKAMLEFAEQSAKERGAQVFSMRDKAGHTHAEMWESMGYRMTDVVYVKDIRDAPA